MLEDPIFRLQVSNVYTESLVLSGRTEVLPKLFGAGKPFGELRLSGDVGLRLSNLALEQGRHQLAAIASASLSEIPAGVDADQWRLHVARVAILAGNYDQGAAALHEWLRASPGLTPDRTDQALQPVFDLQTAGRHDLALDLLLAIRAKTDSPRRRREIAYWIAESYRATRQHIRAAEYFLYSALLQHNGLDQWGEAARLQAAESLQAANLAADARVLFEGILARTEEANRRVQLQQKLQELLLLEARLGAD